MPKEQSPTPEEFRNPFGGDFDKTAFTPEFQEGLIKDPKDELGVVDKSPELKKNNNLGFELAETYNQFKQHSEDENEVVDVAMVERCQSIIDKAYQQFISENDSVACENISNFLTTSNKFVKFLESITDKPESKFVLDLAFRFILDIVINNIDMTDEESEMFKKYYLSYIPESSDPYSERRNESVFPHVADSTHYLELSEKIHKEARVLKAILGGQGSVQYFRSRAGRMSEDQTSFVDQQFPDEFKVLAKMSNLQLAQALIHMFGKFDDINLMHDLAYEYGLPVKDAHTLEDEVDEMIYTRFSSDMGIDLKQIAEKMESL